MVETNLDSELGRGGETNCVAFPSDVIAASLTNYGCRDGEKLAGGGVRRISRRRQPNSFP